MTEPQQPLVSPAVLERFPHYRGVVIYARNLENRASDEFSAELLRAAEAQARSAFGDGKASEHPHIAAWREAFQAFGVKPNKMLNSAEALISRVLKGGELPRINWLADAYNAISVRHVLPIGGEDLDKAVGAQRLEIAVGDEAFDTVKDGAPILEHPQAGEVVWLDDAGVTCRAWNWRQCVRTRLTEDTKNAYFVLDSLSPFSLTELHAAAHELEGYLRQLSPDCNLERFEIGKR
jgi:DNA/RNA-binding domain of Phe-tRNA-synthetase-like protein